MPKARRAAKKPEETIHFEINRTDLLEFLIPLAFVLGIGMGYLLWGRPGATLASNAANPTNVPAAAGDIGDQIASLQRYQVPIDADDAVLGPTDAPITFIEFGDFECPYCQRHFTQTHLRLIEQYGDQIRFVFKHYPLRSIHPNAESAAQASECARAQGKFWEFHDLLFSGNQGLGRDAYEAYARQLDLDTEELLECLDSGRYAERVQHDRQVGMELGVNSTPTFFVNGLAFKGAYPFETFAAVIDYELENTGN